MPTNVALPPIVRRGFTDPPIPRMPWYRGIAPAYLSVFIWAPFFDQLWAGDLPGSGLAWLFGSALLASTACFGLYLVAASWGFRARRPLVVVASSTFGALGSEWLCGVAIALASVVWYAVAINFGVDSTLLGLRACGLIRPSGLAGWSAGPLAVKSPVFLGTALFWIYITRTAIMMRLPGVVVGLMKVYVPVAVLLLTVTALWRLPLLWSAGDINGVARADLARASNDTSGHDSALQMTIGFFAVIGLLSVDWGAAARTRREIILAGLPCVLLASAWTLMMSLIVVLETTSSPGTHGHPLAANPGDPVPFSFRWAVFHGTETCPGYAAAAILILFGLAALAPAVASLERLSEGVSTHWPGLTPGTATILGCALAFFLMATMQVDRLGPIVGAMGVIFAPALGAMAGQSLRRRSATVEIRSGINPAGALAWIAGFALALMVELEKAIGPGLPGWLHETAILGLLTSAVAYWLFASLGFESPGAVLNPVGQGG